MFKRDLVVRVSSSNQDRMIRQAKNTATSSYCRICHAEARIVNYGALSCYSCKTFFRRHATRAKVCLHSPMKNIRPCTYGDRCEITVETRKNCAHCRLAKCLAVGMSIEFIRKEYRRGNCLPADHGNAKAMVSFPDNSLDVLPTTRSSRVDVCLFSCLRP